MRLATTGGSPTILTNKSGNTIRITMVAYNPIWVSYNFAESHRKKSILVSMKSFHLIIVEQAALQTFNLFLIKSLSSRLLKKERKLF
jgi:hypothetical protein